MPATIIGNSADLAFGVGDAQTGMVVQSITHANSSDAVELKNRSGDTTSVVFRNKRVTYTVEGAYTTFSDFVGTDITVAGGETFGLSGAAYVTEITRTRSADNFEQVSYSAVIYDGIA
jgi:hypothetical protein